MMGIRSGRMRRKCKHGIESMQCFVNFTLFQVSMYIIAALDTMFSIVVVVPNSFIPIPHAPSAEPDVYPISQTYPCVHFYTLHKLRTALRDSSQTTLMPVT